MSDPIEPPDQDEDDARAFRRAVAGVRPLPVQPRVPVPRPGPRARMARLERDDVLRESRLVPGEGAAEDNGDSLSFRRPEIREELLRRLKRGRFVVEAEIDLHGLRREEAHDALRQFLADCLLQRLRCVRVIHGKGRRSGPGGPVLKQVVDHWLRRFDDVVAFASARPADGGTGAVHVLLRK
jgi:DNA-nicking Smr family endonuclease